MDNALIFSNVLLGVLGLLIGFKVYVPQFSSQNAKENFYKRFQLLFKIGGFAMLVWGVIQLMMLL